MSTPTTHKFIVDVAVPELRAAAADLAAVYQDLQAVVRLAEDLQETLDVRGDDVSAVSISRNILERQAKAARSALVDITDRLDLTVRVTLRASR